MLASADRSALAVLAGLILLGGCSGGDDDRRERNSVSPARSEELAGPPASHRILEFPSCDGSFVPTRRFLGAGWRQLSTRVGPVRLLNTRGLARRGLVRRHAFVVRALFPPSRAITIGVEGEARSRAGFLPTGTQRWSGSASELYPALIIENCPELPPELGRPPAGRLYGQALFIGMLRPTCVPLLVTRNGGRTHRRAVSFGAGDCPGGA